MTRLHPDWPEVDLPQTDPEYGYGHLPTPYADLAQALDGAWSQKAATPMPSDVERPVRIGDLAEVVRYRIAYSGQQWHPGQDGSTELSLVVVARTTDDRWVAIEAWNDFTGWGCQDDSDVRIGGTENQVVSYGLTAEGRALLGYPAVTA